MRIFSVHNMMMYEPEHKYGKPEICSSLDYPTKFVEMSVHANANSTSQDYNNLDSL